MLTVFHRFPWSRTEWWMGTTVSHVLITHCLWQNSVRFQYHTTLQSFQLGSGAHPAFCSVGTGSTSPGSSDWGMNLNTYFHLVRKLWMSGICLHSTHTRTHKLTSVVEMVVCIEQLVQYLLWGSHGGIWVSDHGVFQYLWSPNSIFTLIYTFNFCMVVSSSHCFHGFLKFIHANSGIICRNRSRGHRLEVITK